MQYAAIINSTIHHDGDERSRTHPGHGYPAYTETVETLQKFASEDEMLEWCCKRSQYEFYTLIEYNIVHVETTLSVRRR